MIAKKLIKTTNRMEENHKAIAIPVTEVNGELKFLIVHDKRFREWTFVTGGCRHREIINPIRTALRELEEETRGVVALKKGTYNYFKFNATFEPLEKAIYHVYIFPVTMDTLDMKTSIDKFDKEKWKMDTNQVCFRKNYDENDFMKFSNLEEIKTCSSTWKFILDNIIENKDFYDALYDKNFSHFNIV